MDQELKDRLNAIEKKVEAAYVSAEKTRKYFLIAVVVSVVAFVLPLIGLVVAVPSMMSTYSTMLEL